MFSGTPYTLSCFVEHHIPYHVLVVHPVPYHVNWDTLYHIMLSGTPYTLS